MYNFFLICNNKNINKNITRRKIMKATGVVRRIDDLGRVVIPKEIRKTLRIKEGDPLEIFTDREGQVILKKYSPIGELSEFAAGYAETLSKTTGHIACITDKDTIIAVSGGSKKEFLEQDISQELEKLMEDKEVYTSKENSDIAMPITKNDNQERKNNAQVVYPIVSNGDTIGTVILMSKEPNGKMNDVEKKVAQSAATFLGSQMDI
jgi:AbrB family transcriptional regulator (stage V sporulation protein T)